MHFDTLRQACANLARTTMWDLRPVDTERIQALADQFFGEAAKCMELIDPPDDPAVVVHAVDFLRSTYAIPPIEGRYGVVQAGTRPSSPSCLSQRGAG